MLMKQQQQQARRQAGEMIGRAGIHVTDQEAEGIEVVDFGLSRLRKGRCAGADAGADRADQREGAGAFP